MCKECIICGEQLETIKRLDFCNEIKQTMLDLVEKGRLHPKVCESCAIGVFCTNCESNECSQA